uniref:transposase n=1 Tax=Ruegeria discodermiae TaxID=3064389 RepID=UPI0035321C05
MSKPSSARYRVTNWSDYNAALKKRGSLLVWLDKDVTWLAAHEGRPGRPPVFSNAAIQFCLSIKGICRKVSPWFRNECWNLSNWARLPSAAAPI